MNTARRVAVALVVMLASATAGHAAPDDGVADGAAGIATSLSDSSQDGNRGIGRPPSLSPRRFVRVPAEQMPNEIGASSR